MSVISTAYDAIVLEVQEQLASHVRLPNPYEVDKNIEPILKLGWGIKLGPAVNTHRMIDCHATFERDVSIVITRKFYAQELNATDKASVEKLLLEDQFLILKEFEKRPQVNNTSGVIKFIYESDTGIESVFVNEAGNFLKIESVFKLEYEELLS